MGATGLETAFAALHTGLVLPGVLTSTLLVERHDRGRRAVRAAVPTLASGGPANVVLVDLDAEWEVGESGYESRSANCCFAGRALHRAGPADRRRGRGRLPRALVRARRPFERLPAARGRHALRRRSRRGRRFRPPARSSSPPAMSGYQESVTDPSYRGQIIIFTYPQIGNYGVSAERDGVRSHPRARGGHARGRQPRGRAGRRGRLADLARATAASRRSPASTRARSCATSATRARCAAACSPARCPRTRRASA